MRIALLIDSLAGGGSEGVVHRLARGLAQRGHRVFVYCLKQAGATADSLRGARVAIREAQSTGLDPTLPWQLGRWLRRDGVQIVHAHSCAALACVFPAAKLLNRPLVHVRHGWALGYADRYSRWADRLSPFVSAVVINGESGRARLPRDRVACRAMHIPNGLDVAPAPPAEARPALEALCGRALPGPVILTVANVRPEKDTLGLLEAFAHLRRGQPQAHLVCVGGVGDDEYSRQVQHALVKLRLHDVVCFPGHQPGASRFMPGADILCLNSRSEAMPNVILEAMAQHVPIVATTVGDIGRLGPAGDAPHFMLRDGQTARLVPPGDPHALADALQDVLNDRLAAQRRAARAAEDYARRYTTAHMVHRYEQLYDECLRRRRSSPPRRRACTPPCRPAVLMVGPAPPQMGGMATSIGVLLKSPLRHRFALHRFATTCEPARAEENAFRHTGLWPSLARHLNSLRRLAAEIRRRRIRLVHIHTCSYFTFYRNLLDLLVARLLRRRVLLHIRGGQFEPFYRASGRLGRGVIRCGLRWANAVVLLSDTLRNALRDALKGANTFVVPNAFDPDVLPAIQAPSASVAERQPATADRACRFLYLAELTERKGLGDLLEAARQVRMAGVPFDLIVAGPSSAAQRARWHTYVHERGLADVVKLIGPVEGPGKTRLLVSADCFVHPSHSEGLPNAILEAAAVGLPVIATAVGAVPEVIGPLAPLVPPRDPGALAREMARFASDTALRQRTGAALGEHVRANYSAARVADGIARVYEYVLAGRPAGRASSAPPAPASPPRPHTPERPTPSEWLVGRVVLPLHERLRGRRTLHEKHALESSLAQSAEAVQQECAGRLRALLRFASQHLPYYANLFAERAVNPAADDPYAELAKLPVLRKADVRANEVRMIYPAVPGGLQPALSGGTSGDTLHFYIDRLRAAQSMAARLCVQELWGVRPGDRRLWLWGSPLELQRSRLRRWRDRLLNEIVLDAFDMSATQIDVYLRRILSYRPRLIIGYTSAVALLAQHAAERYGPADFPWLRAVVLTGDEVHAEHRALVRQTFGCPAVSEYGSREVGLIGYDCPRGRLHVLSPHVYVEITQNDERVPAGVCGNITCTNLNTRAQPLIRYYLGDVGTLATDGCDCGLPLPVLEVVGARITGFVALPDGRLRHGHLVAYLVRQDPCVVEFKVYQRTLDEFDVLLVVSDRFTPATLAGIVARFREYFGPRVRVHCTLVDRIPPDPSGKRRHVVSDVAPQYDRFEVLPTPALAEPV